MREKIITQAEKFLLEENKKNFFKTLSLAIEAFDKKKNKTHTFSYIYKKACVLKQSFYDYYNHKVIPGKDTVFKLALALECSIEETEVLLKSAGYAFCESSKRDFILKKCLEKKIFWISNVNDILKEESESLLSMIKK